MSKLLLVFIVTLTMLKANIISGIGYGVDEKESKRESLADLSNAISVNVKSDFTTIKKSLDNEYSKSNEKIINLSSNLPIIGVHFEKSIGHKLIKTKAVLSSETSLKLYEEEIMKLKKGISFNYLELEGLHDDDMKYTLLNQLLADIDSFNKYKIVATLLGAKKLPTLNVNSTDMKTKLLRLTKKVKSINIASDLLTKDITQKNIYLSALKVAGSNDVTQFSRILKSQISSKLSTVKYSNNADYFLRGNYEILKNSILITLKLTDQNNQLIKTITLSLHNEAYKDINYKVSSKTFDAAMNEGFVKSGELKVKIGFKGYSRENGIDLYANDEVDIVIKTNKAMCYFLVGHTLKEKDKFSYILPIGSDDNPFISRITGEDVNHYITIADRVPIEEPFGRESLQVFSSTFSKNGSCPLIVPYCKEDDDGYCIVKGKPNKVIGNTRALNLKRRKHKVENAESSIEWHSFESVN